MTRLQVLCIVTLLLLADPGAATAKCSAAQAQTSASAKLISDAKAQQKKVDEIGKKVIDANEAYRKAAEGNKPDAAALRKAFDDARAEYQKELATFRELKAKLDEASKQDGDAAKARDQMMNGLAELIKKVLEIFLGGFLSGMDQEQKSAILDASTKVVLGEPASAKDIEALAKIPDFSKVTGDVADFYKSLQATKDWPAIRDKIVDAAVQQFGQTSSAGQAAAVLNAALKAGKSVNEIVTAVQKLLPGGKFTKQESRDAFMGLVRSIAPPEVADAVGNIKVEE